MSGNSADRSDVIHAMIVASCIHWEEPVSADLIINQCLSRYNPEPPVGELSGRDLINGIASLERSRILSSTSLRTLVEDYASADANDLDDVLISEPDIISLGRGFPAYLQANFGLLESAALGLGFSFDLSRPLSDTRPEVPAADRFVSRSDNLEAVETVEREVLSAIRVIEKSNTLAPDEKSLWLELIGSGLRSLKNPKILVAGLSAFLVKPLYDAFASVIEESAKPVIRSALDAVLTLIGLA